MRSSVFLFLVLTLAAATVGAQVYRWTDENGKVHYGDKPPAGKPSTTLAKPPGVSGSASITTEGTIREAPLPKPTPADLEHERRVQEYVRKSDEERRTMERAAFRSSPAGVYHCQELDQSISDAQQGFVRGRSYAQQLDAEQQKEVLAALTARRDQLCR